jgi:hypothetical protein
MLVNATARDARNVIRVLYRPVLLTYKNIENFPVGSLPRVPYNLLKGCFPHYTLPVSGRTYYYYYYCKYYNIE